MKNILPYGGKLFLIKRFYQQAEADQLFTVLLQDLAWQQEKIFLYGRWIRVPRLMCWYGDNNAQYKYSGVNHQPLTWTKTLLSIKQKIEKFYPCQFNSVMANLYRNGDDSMGCHADNEKELGDKPLIVSLSLGEQRLLKFRHQNSQQVLGIVLRHGDLLIMAGEIQQNWRHELPKIKKLITERINLTFRQVTY